MIFWWGIGQAGMATFMWRANPAAGGAEPPVEEVLAARSWSSKRRRLRGRARRR